MLGIISISIVFLVLIFSFYNADLIKIKTIKLQSKKIQNQKKILFISDVHLGTNSIKHLLKIVSKINQLDFDMLLIGKVSKLGVFNVEYLENDIFDN